MKLRNKKTGEIKDFGNLQVYAEAENTDETQLLGNFDSFKQILEYYEDYIPTEPLIKDKRIRKLVRDWAEINDIKTVVVCESFNSWGFKNRNNGVPGDKEYIGADILFRGEKPEELEFGKKYAVSELCEDVKELIIKDKKIRKAVREWAEANDIKEIIIFDFVNNAPYTPVGTVDFAENAGHLKIQFRTEEKFNTDKIYTVNELCGDNE